MMQLFCMSCIEPGFLRSISLFLENEYFNSVISFPTTQKQSRCMLHLNWGWGYSMPMIPFTCFMMLVICTACRFGKMVACFRYASIDVHSVYLPPSKLEFNYESQEWIERELNEVNEYDSLMFFLSEFLYT